MQTYPEYPYGGSPAEATALLYTLPGFITGLLALGLIYIVGKRFHVISLVFMFLVIAVLAAAEFFFGFFGLVLPVPYDPPEESIKYTVISERGLVRQNGSTEIESQNPDAIHFKEGLAAYKIDGQ